MFNFFKKKPEAVKKLKPVRIAVHGSNGVTVAHYAIYRTLKNDGGLSLHDKEDGGCVVADYAAGRWVSVTIGKRSIQ